MSVSSDQLLLRQRFGVLEATGCGLITVLLAWAYYPAVRSLIAAWSSNTQTYSYGFLIPFVTAALIWVRREKLAGLPIAPNFLLGIPCTLLGLAILFAGRISMLSILEELSLIVTLAGLTLLLTGLPMLTALAFPIGYLIAMIPAWDALTGRIHPYFQDLSATIGMAVLRMLSIPAIRHGLFIELPDVTLEVAQECSGVNNLIAVLCVGIPMVHLFVPRWWKRAVILSIGVAIAALSNGARVAMVSVFAYYGIRGANGDIHGPYSLLRSLLVSAVGFVALFWLVSRFGDEGANPREPQAPVPPPDRKAPVFELTALAVATLMLSVTLVLMTWQRPSDVPLRAHLGTFPHQIGNWESIARDEVPHAVEHLNFDAQLSRSYRDPSGAEASVFIGYYAQQREGQEIADFRMREMLRGADASAVTLYKIGANTVTDFVTTEGGQRIHVSYWYVLHGRPASRDFQAKIYTAWNALAHHATDGAVIVVKTKFDPTESLDTVRTRVSDFIGLVHTTSGLYLPQS